MTSKSGHMRTREAAEYLGVGYRTLQRYIADGLVTCVKPAGQWLFRKKDLDAFLANER